jgi:hypothetical protein
MPRRARLSLPGVPWHIIQRGNNRSVCFHAEEDYQFYLHYLKEFADKFGCAVHAYVLMTNHVHLLLTPRRGGRFASHYSDGQLRVGSDRSAPSEMIFCEAKGGLGLVVSKLARTRRSSPNPGG